MEHTLNANEYMAEGRIGKLMMKFSIPCIMSLLVSSLYNIVDQIFIGRGIGYLGNGATNRLSGHSHRTRSGSADRRRMRRISQHLSGHER